MVLLGFPLNCFEMMKKVFIISMLMAVCLGGFAQTDHWEMGIKSTDSWKYFVGTEDEDEVLWVGTFGGGLNKFYRKEEIFVSYKNNPEDDKSISGNEVTSIITDSKGNLWLTFERGGVCHFDKSSETFFRIQEKDGLSSNYTYSVL
ncbi:hypothetical protein N9934_05370, partial [Desulfosarcina sp.]|nr:hypothetical protein [Desulfosarcina sp.]